MKPILDYDLCMAAGQDAGNKNMRKDGRKQWNKKDWNIAAEISNKLIAKIKEEPIANQPKETS